MTTTTPRWSLPTTSKPRRRFCGICIEAIRNRTRPRLQLRSGLFLCPGLGAAPKPLRIPPINKIDFCGGGGYSYAYLGTRGRRYGKEIDEAVLRNYFCDWARVFYDGADGPAVRYVCADVFGQFSGAGQPDRADYGGG